MRQSHVLYIDDSGTKEYQKDRKYSLKAGNSRYFVFCGILLTMQCTSQLLSKLIDLKLKHFSDDTVELKANWFNIPYKRKDKYLVPYEISDGQMEEFIADCYSIITEIDCKLIAAVVDKQHMQEDYKSPYYPPAVAYEALLLRVQQELEIGETVAVIMDDTTGKTPKGNEYKILMEKQHKSLKKHGSKLWKGQKFPCLESLRFVSSQVSQLMQFADICAYNVHKQFTDFGSEWEDENIKQLPLNDHFIKIHKKFRCDPVGKVQGYGIVKLPQRKKIQWSI